MWFFLAFNDTNDFFVTHLFNKNIQIFFIFSRLILRSKQIALLIIISDRGVLYGKI